MPAKVLAIWLDAAEPLLLEQMMANGEMPNLRRLCARGTYGRLVSLEHSLSETAYGMILTGQPPERTGTWNIGEFDTKTYREGGIERTDYNGIPFFLELDPTLRTCVFDIPGLPLLPNLNGIQVTSWGAHSPKISPRSSPPELLAELTARYGAHPGSGYNDYACLHDPLAMRSLRERILAGIPRRGAIIRDLLARSDWDLFLTSFGEPHGVGHVFWPHPECLSLLQASGTLDAVTDVYRAVDQELGKIAATAGEATRIVLFSIEGMCADNFDVQNMVLLPELLYRHSFPGCVGFDFDPHRPPSPESQAGIKNWVMEVWHQRRRPFPLENWLRDRLPLPLAMKLFRWLGLQPPLFHPLTETFWNFQPTTWSIPYRPYMKAFTLITASDGCIRLNVRGRESQGLIAASDFRATCAEITAMLMELRDAETGKAAVQKVLPMRVDPHAWGETDTDADLIVKWNPGVGTRLVSPNFGSLGPVPFHRTSAHTPDGFLSATGPGVPIGRFTTGEPIDIAPTILKLLGSESARELPGRCLLDVMLTDRLPKAG